MPSKNKPDITVILPVYNGEEHIAECIESVLNQTFENFEFTIVDDASTDKTPTILKKYSEKDKRIKVITHAKNRKQTAAANTAIETAQGNFIARIDADDVALPERFEKQRFFLIANEEYGMVGSWTDTIDENGDIMGQWKTSSTDGSLKWDLLFGTSFAHASVMMRTKIVKQVGLYQSPEAEDYDLWSRISHVSKVANIGEVLQQKRVWSGQLALKVPQETRDCVIEIMQKNINNLLGNNKLDLNFIRKIRAVSDKTPIIQDKKVINNIRYTLNRLYKNLQLNVKLSKTEKIYINRDIYQKLKTLSNWQSQSNYLRSLYHKFYLLIKFPKYSLLNIANDKKIN